MTANNPAFKGFDRQVIEEIKDRIPIDTVVKRYVRLKNIGRNLFGKCPFHTEDTPSFSVNPELKIYKCFGCGEHGDVISFLQKIENLEFPEVITRLAKEAGIQIKTSNISDKNYKTIVEAKNIYELVQKFFTYYLNDKNKGLKARKYLENRNLSSKSSQCFEIGYAPTSENNDILTKFLIKKGIPESKLIEYGLSTQKWKYLRDRFYDRIMFPIQNTSGNILAFSGRVLDKDDKRPKYLNSPETVIFKKRYNLFGIFQARKYISDKDFVILHEGQTDVISDFSIGIRNAVAPLGTGLTKEQLQILSRYTKNIAIAFDSDAAGIKASVRAAALAYEQGFNVFIINIPYGKDADECIRHDKKLWITAVKNRTPAISNFIGKLTERVDPSSVQGKKIILTKILPIINIITDKVVQDHFIKEISAVIDTPEDLIKQELRNLSKRSAYSTTSQSPQKPGKMAKALPNQPNINTFSHETYLLRLFCSDPKLFTKENLDIDLNFFQDEFIKKIFEIIKNEKVESLDNLFGQLSTEEQDSLKNLIMNPDQQLLSNDNLNEIQKEISDTIAQIKTNGLKIKYEEVRRELKRAEISNDIKKATELSEKLNELGRKIKNKN
ncbi:DNA primase [Candidatus Dojkabacteria bacterium]|nr:DNA primase [Candidatus Dojkabacteria bacterium]